jgi:hypothetical protein
MAKARTAKTRRQPAPAALPPVLATPVALVCLDCTSILASVAEMLRKGGMNPVRAAVELEQLAQARSAGRLSFD